jgi:hypothetical protein
MKSRGVSGAQSSSAVAARYAAGIDLVAQALAEGAVADLVVIL